MNKQDFQLWEMRARDSIDVKRCYIDAVGDLVGGVLLSQIIFWHLPDEHGKSKLRVWRDECEWLAKKRDDWWKECRITPKQFDRALEILEQKKLVITKLFRFAGSPTKHIRLNWDGLFNALKSLSDNVFPQRSKSNSPKGQYPIPPKVEMDIDKTGRTYTEITAEITAKNTHTQEAREEEKFGQEEESPKSSNLLAEKTESLDEVQDPVLDQSSAATTALNFQNYIHPTQKCDDRFNRKLHPWQLSDKPNDFDKGFIHYLCTFHLPRTSMFKGTVVGEEEAEIWINKRSITQQGLAEIDSRWRAYLKNKQAEVARDNRVSAAATTIPRFNLMDRSEHCALISQWRSLGDKLFLAQETWHTDWLKFVKRFRSELLEEMTA